MSDRLTLVCSPTEGTRPEDQLAGVIESDCDTCGEAIWIAPSGQTLIANERDVDVICVPCAMKRRDLGQLMRPTREQLEELRRHFSGEAPVW